MPNAGEITHDRTFWFQDGSIVLVAEGTGFRVHQSLLSRASTVLRDLLAAPQPAILGDAGIDIIEGVPAVRVPDSPFDMRCMLRAIYDGPNYLEGVPPDTERFSILSALMRLGRKYSLPSVLREATRRLEDYFATDFDQWLEEHDFSDIYEPYDFSYEEITEHIEAVNLMRFMHKIIALPMTIYECCQADVHELLQGCERDDGGVERLNNIDLEQCLRCREHLLHESAKFVPFIARATVAAGCQSKVVCAWRVQVLARTVVQNAQDHITTDALAPLQARLGAEIVHHDCWAGLCGACRDALVEQYKTQLRGAWDLFRNRYG